MFKKVEQIDSLEKFSLSSNNSIILESKNKITLLRDNVQSEVKSSLNSLFELIVNNNLIFGYDWNGLFFKYDINKQKTIEEGVGKDFIPLIEKQEVLEGFDEKGESYYGLLNTTENKIKWKLPLKLFNHQISDNNDFIFVLTKRNRLTTIDRNKGLINWEYNLGEFADYLTVFKEKKQGYFVRILGECNGLIWVSTTNQFLIALNALNGEIVLKIKTIPNFENSNFSNSIPDSQAMILDKNSGKIIGFMFEFFWEVDCKTGEIILTDLSKEFKELSIKCENPSFAYDGKYIYFVQQVPGKIGAFNTESKSLEWQYSFEEMNSRELFPKEVKYSEDKLYALDSKGTLHIFEKDRV